MCFTISICSNLKRRGDHECSVCKTYRQRTRPALPNALLTSIKD